MIQRQTYRRTLTVALSIGLLSAAAATLAVDPGPDFDDGIWVESEVQDCPGNLVCTEWELLFGESNEPPCCQDASMVGSTTFNACALQGSHFRH